MHLAALDIKFGRDLPVGMLLIDGGAEDAFGGPGHQVWRQGPCGDTAGWRRGSSSFAAVSLLVCLPAAAHITVV